MIAHADAASPFDLDLAATREELRAPIPRLPDGPLVQLASIGTFRRDGRLTGASLSYFDLRFSVESPPPPSLDVPSEVSDWIGRLRHPLLADVIRVSSDEELEGADDGPKFMLASRSPLATQAPISAAPRALELDGRVVAGWSADTDQSFHRAITLLGSSVSVCVPRLLVEGDLPQITLL